jgi:arsenite methyltransferase
MKTITDTTKKIIERYNRESSSCSNLSCGGNLTYLNPLVGENILDMGSGRGTETIEVSKLVAPSGFVTGIDLSDKMVFTALENAHRENISNIDFILCPIEKMPFGNESFDGIISNCVINHAKDKKAVYSEIYRVLKTGGRFVVSDAVTKTLLPQEISDNPDMVAECFGGAIPMKAYLKNIIDAGFTKIEILKKREYIKNGFDFISITLLGYKD